MRSGTKSLICSVFVFFLLWLSLRFLLPFALPFLLGTLLALAAEPAVSFLCGPLRLPRGLGSGIGVTAVFILGAGLLLSLAALVIQQLRALAGILPDLEAGIRTAISLLEGWLLDLSAAAPLSIRPLLQQNVRNLFSDGTAFLDQAVRFLLGLAGGFLTHIPDRALSLGTGILSGFMISAKLPRLRIWFHQRLSSEILAPMLAVLRRLRSTLGRWLLAQLRLSCVTFFILTAGLILLAVPYAPLWALAIAMLDALPVLGTGSVMIPWALVCFLSGRQAMALGLLGTYLTAALTRSLLEPRMVGKQLGLDPLAALAALYAGYRLWGFGGLILAPMLAVTVLQLRRENPPDFPG